MHPLLRGLLRQFLLVAVATSAAVVVTTGVSVAARAVAPSRANPDLSGPPAGASALARADVLSRAIGLPSGPRSVQRVVDPFDHRTFDEVTTRDDRGRPTAILRLMPDGRLRLAVALGLHESRSALDAAGAIRGANAIARAAGVTVRGQPRAAASSGAGGWLVSWPREVDGAPVRGDGTRVALWSDGVVHSVSTTEQSLAPRPAIVATESRAGAAASAVVSARFGAAADDLTTAGSALAWIVPNDAFGASVSDPAAGTARLAWVVGYRATGALADRLTAIEIWLDAGDLTVIGGDVAE